MDTQSSNDDCYFYYYSSCIRGVDCQFRHCEAALGTEMVCSLWKEGRCYRDNCKFRHMESRIQRSTIPCYWENQLGGCRKPHCVFFHTKYRRDTSSENQGLILPISNQSPTLVPNPTMSSVPSDALKSPNYSNVDSLFTNENLSLSPASQPVEPVVVSLDEGEESDAESVSSAPMKSVPIKTDVRTCKDAEEKDFGVKTLEQLRMEKIHRESEHFYKSDDVSDAKIMAGNNRNSSLHEDSEMYFSDYCMPSHEVMQLDHKSESNVYKNFYPPDSSDVIILSNSPSHEEKDSLSGVVGLRSENLPSIRGDLRSRIKKSMGEQQTAAQEKRTLSLKRKSDPEDDSFDFKIKTLDEIRKEKLKKVDETLMTKSPPPAYELTELQQALDNRRKIRKLFRDPFTAHKEEREVQKSLEQKLRIDPIKTIQNGSINGLSAEVFVKDVESSCPKTGGTVKNSTPNITLSDDEVAIPTNKTKEDSVKSSPHSQNHGLRTTLKNGSIDNATNITLSRKLRPIARNKRTTDPVAAPVQEKTKEGNLPTNDSEIHTEHQNISPADEHMTPPPKKPLVTNTDSDTTNMSNDDKLDIENQHLLDYKMNVEDQHLPGNKLNDDDQHLTGNKPNVEDQHLPGNTPNVEDQHLPVNKPTSGDQQTVLGDKASPIESTSTIEQKIEPMNIAAERSTSVDDFDNLFNDSDMMLEESEVEHSDKKAEDIFLEIEQMLDS